MLIKILATTCFTLGLLALLTRRAMAKTKRQADYVVLILLDSFSPHYMAMYDLPNLRKLTKQGVWYSRAQGIFPANTTANHTAILTGAYPNKTGIPNNSRYDRSLDKLRSPLRDIQVPTLPEILAEHNLVTVELAHFLLEGRRTIRYPEHGAANFKKGMEEHNPALTIYLDMNVDTQGHAQGPYNLHKQLAETDSQIGEILDYLGEQEKLEKTAIIVASDHSMIENSLPETAPTLLADLSLAGFSVATANHEIHAATDLVAITAGSVFLYLRENRFDDTRYHELLEFLKAIPNTDVFTAEELVTKNADPYALGDIVVAPRPGYVLKQGSGGGIHGVPETQHTTLVLSGSGIRSGLIQGRANTVDIAPTILQLLGLEIPKHMDGKPLNEALEISAFWESLFTTKRTSSR